MAKISTYPITQPTINDILIGSDVDNINVTKNFLLGDILQLVPVAGLNVQSLNTLTGAITLLPQGGIAITQVGNDIVLDTSDVGEFRSLTTTGTSGAATLTGGVLNIPDYDNTGITSLTTTGTSGVATLASGVLNIPDYTNTGISSLTTTGTSGSAATLIAGVLDIPTPIIPTVPFTSLTTTGTSGVATLSGGVLNIPDYDNTGVTSLTTIGVTGLATLSAGVLNIPDLSREYIRLVAHVVNDITASQTLNLSRFVSVNIIDVINPGLTITIQFPPTPVEGQICEFTTLRNTVTIVAGSGNFMPLYSGAPVAGYSVTYVYNSARGMWFRISS
tara:strand:- start:7798 stop:8793 length:996 start_codon:yes stop_codon:yes gene_type:complete